MTIIHHFKQTVNFPDIDAGGGMFHGRYLDYYDRARYDYFLGHGINLHELLLSGTALVVVEANARYLKPILLTDTLHIYSSPVLVGTKCIKFSQAMCTDIPGEFKTVQALIDAKYPKNFVEVSLVSVNLHEKKAISMPQSIMSALR